VKKPNNKGDLPLHYALCKKASPDVINMLFQANPKAAEVQNNYGESPNEIALCKKASDDAINMLKISMIKAQRYL
jgi:hypothetical protein